jgi:AraC-like DNA-binding protein
MALELLPLVLHHAHVPPAHKLVLMGIANHQRDNRAWPSVATLAGYAEVSERHVQRILRDLEEQRLITVQRSKGVKGLNVYALNIICPPDCDRTPNHRRGVTPRSPRGDISRTLGVTPRSPEPVSINQYRTSEIELKRMREQLKVETMGSNAI